MWRILGLLISFAASAVLLVSAAAAQDALPDLGAVVVGVNSRNGKNRTLSSDPSW